MNNPKDALIDYAEWIAGYFEGHDIFYRADGDEALIVAQIDGGPTHLVSVMLGTEPQHAVVGQGGWSVWQAPADAP